MKMESVYLQ